MSAAGREKLWAREKSERIKQPESYERKPFHGVIAARKALCMPEPEREEKDAVRHLPSAAERELFFDRDAMEAQCASRPAEEE